MQTTEDTRKGSRSSRCITGHAANRRVELYFSLLFCGLTRIRLHLAIYFCLRRGSLLHNTAGQQPLFLESRDRISGARTRAPKISVKSYMSYKRAANSTRTASNVRLLGHAAQRSHAVAVTARVDSAELAVESVRHIIFVFPASDEETNTCSRSRE